MRKSIVAITLMLAAVPLFAANPHETSCSLDRSVLAPYNKPSATEEEWGASRRAISKFMGCAPSTIDNASRRVFFEVVGREFATDHKPALDKWRARRPGSEALFEGITVFQHELRSYMERLADPRLDAESKDTVLRYGTAKTIAAFGPAVKGDVLKMLGKPNAAYGVSRQYNSQVDALATLGEWVDSSNGAFNAQDKGQFAEILAGLLPLSDSIRPGQHTRLVETTLKALGRSDDARAEKAIRHWMEKQSRKEGWLYELASKSASNIQKKAQKKNG